MNKRALIVVVSLLASAGLFLALPPSSAGKPPAGRAPKPATERRVLPKVSLPLAADEAPDPSGSKAEPEQVFFARWGGGRGDLGRERPAEGNAIGPMSFAVDAKGRVNVLDSVNGRIVRRGADGKPEQSVRVEAMNPEDIAVGADGSRAVLDRFADKSVSIYDDAGKLQGKLPLVGAGISDVGSVTGVFVDGKDVYAEREHGTLVKLGGLDGAPAEPRTEIPGRPSRDGSAYLSAGITEAAAGRAYVASVDRATESQRFTRELRIEGYLRSIVLLDSDKHGTVYFASEFETGPNESGIVLTCLDPLSGMPVGSAVLPVNTMPEESFRDLVVLDGGGVMAALRSETGVSYTRYDCR